MGSAGTGFVPPGPDFPRGTNREWRGACGADGRDRGGVVFDRRASSVRPGAGWGECACRSVVVHDEPGGTCTLRGGCFRCDISGTERCDLANCYWRWPMSSGRRAAPVSYRSLALRGLPLFAGIASPLYMQLSRLVFGFLALSKGGEFRTNPAGGVLFQDSEGWPPFVLPSGLFWLVSAAMLALLVIVYRKRAESLDFALQPWVLAFWCGLAAFYGRLHSLFFIDLAEWPRDSFAAALVLAAECLAFFALGVERAVRSIVARRELKAAQRGDGPRPARAGLRPEDES